MDSKELFAISLEVIQLVEKHTKHTATALRILDAAKHGFGDGFTDSAALRQSLRAVPESLPEEIPTH